MLSNPPDGEWLTWRRAFDAQGFSPLAQITRANVADLRLAWSWALPNGANEVTPLVHDGVMFVHAYGDKVQALDAATGDLLWQYSRRLPRGHNPTVKRGIALYGGRLYVPTSDTHMVALNAKTGDVVWDQAVADYKAGYGMTGGPLVANGKVMIGTTGRAPGGNFIVALDAETGKEAWRFSTIARPGEAGGHTWNGLPLEKRNGASVWVPASYDRALNLAFFGPAQTYDTGPLRNPADEGDVTNDGLYTDSTLAINVDTGKLVWFFQHQPNDQWDLDWAFERHVIPLRVNGVEKTLVVTGGKQAIFDAMEAATGAYAFSMDLGVQNVVTAIDPKTGAKTIDPKLVPGDGRDQVRLSARRRREVVAAFVVQPAHEDAVRPARGVVHGSHAGRERRAGQPVDRRALEPAAASEQRRQVRPAPGDQPRDASVGLDRASACTTDNRDAGDGRRRRLRGRARSRVRRLRRRDRQGAVARATRRCAEQCADQLPGQRQTVRGDGRRQRRRAGDHVPAARAGDQESSGPWGWRVGVRTAQPVILGSRLWALGWN